MSDSLTGLEIGSTFAGRFTVQKKIGAGPIGEVFRVVENERLYALKAFLPKVVPGYISAKKMEAIYRGKSIKHMGVVAPTEFGEEKGIKWALMPLIEGHSLESLLNAMSDEEELADGPLAAVILDHVGNLLVNLPPFAAHGALKPSNILVPGMGPAGPFPEDAPIYITDFGTANILSFSKYASLQLSAGKPYYYLAPEYISHGGKVDKRADQYSLGVLGYELLTGKVPRKGYKPVCDINTKLPEEWDDLIHRLLAKRPEDRFSSIDELREVLQELVPEIPHPAEYPTSEAGAGPGPPTDGYDAMLAGAIASGEKMDTTEDAAPETFVEPGGETPVAPVVEEAEKEIEAEVETEPVVEETVDEEHITEAAEDIEEPPVEEPPVEVTEPEVTEEAEAEPVEEGETEALAGEPAPAVAEAEAAKLDWIPDLDELEKEAEPREEMEAVEAEIETEAETDADLVEEELAIEPAEVPAEVEQTPDAESMEDIEAEEEIEESFEVEVDEPDQVIDELIEEVEAETKVETSPEPETEAVTKEEITGEPVEAEVEEEVVEAETVESAGPEQLEFAEVVTEPVAEEIEPEEVEAEPVAEEAEEMPEAEVVEEAEEEVAEAAEVEQAEEEPVAEEAEELPEAEAEPVAEEAEEMPEAEVEPVAEEAEELPDAEAVEEPFFMEAEVAEEPTEKIIPPKTIAPAPAKKFPVWIALVVVGALAAIVVAVGYWQGWFGGAAGPEVTTIPPMVASTPEPTSEMAPEDVSPAPEATATPEEIAAEIENLIQLAKKHMRKKAYVRPRRACVLYILGKIEKRDRQHPFIPEAKMQMLNDLRTTVKQALAGEKWDEALAGARDGLVIKPRDREFMQYYAEAKNQRDLARLLKKMEAYIYQQRYVAPPDACAFYVMRQIEKIHPHHPEVVKARAIIVQQLLYRAQQALNQQQWDQAIQNAQNGLQVEPGNGDLSAVLEAAKKAKEEMAAVTPEPTPILETPTPEPSPTPEPIPAIAQRCPNGMRYVPGGSLRMGSAPNDPARKPGEKPNTPVFVPGYCIDLYEYPNQPGTMPRINVSWQNARQLCAQQGKRLCSEREWERACKGPGNSRYPYGDSFNPNVCATQDANGSARGMASSGGWAGCRSSFGVYDLSGNVREWTGSPIAPGQSAYVVRGGSASQPGWAVRCAVRESSIPSTTSGSIGFRCCRDPSQ